ncbi:MAG: type I secretion system permease/ATPase [Betaproteobacteria bacterium]|nr:type I secretion system permease/ATPase [Betaproteobacteria bacterium]
MREYLDKCKFFFVYTGVFSFFINLLMLASPLFIMQIFDRVLSSRSNETLIMLTIAAMGAFLIMAVLEMLRSRLLVRASVALDRLISASVLSELLKSSGRPTPNPYPYGMRDVATLRTYLTSPAIFAFFDAPWSPIFVLVIFLFHPLFGIIATLGIAILFGLAIVDEKTTQGPLTEYKNRSRVTGEFVEASARNAEAVNALGMLPAVTRRWSRLNGEAMDMQMLVANRAGKIVAVTKFVRFALQITMLAAGAFLIIDFHTTPGIMIAATLILGRALAPVEMAIAGWKGMIEARAAYGRLGKLLDASRQEVPGVELPEPAGRLAVEKVTFARTIANPVIRGVSFELEPGESLGLIGPSAAGKSTLARIVIGIWPPFSGAVRLDGANIAEWDREHLAKYLGYLPQDVELFSGTVAENIARLGDPAQCSEEVIAAAKKAAVHDMILHLPNGYETEIGPNGTVLSGGQRQRIALARALFGNPRMVVLDEPNSNLDTDGKQALMQAMDALKRDGVTVIIITHRPSMLANIDKMLYLKNGQVELFGARQEVMAKLARASGSLPVSARPQAIG